MTVALAGAIRIYANITLQQAIGLGTGQIPVNEKITQDFTDGSGDDQCHFGWSSAARAIAASGTDDLDLNASLTDGFGNSITITKLKLLIIKAAATNTDDLLIGAAASHPLAIFGDAASDILKLKPGGTLILMAPKAAGYGVVAATSDVLRVANNSSSVGVAYDILVAGA